MSGLRLSFLGPPQVEFEEKPVRLETRKSLAILAYLSVSKREVPREVLATLFWGEYDQQHAQGNLRRNLSSLHQHLGFEGLITEREAISLIHQAGLWLDVDEFNFQLEASRRHGCENQVVCPECLNHLEAAVTLYRGDFLEGFNLRDCPEFDDWQFNQREMLRNQLAFALDKLASFYESRQNWEKAIEVTRQWVALDRLNEAAQRILIQRYVQSGNRGAALRQYEELTRLLREELGQAPAQESLDLYQSIDQGRLWENKARWQSQVPAEESNEASQPILKVKTFIPSFSGKRVTRSRLLSLLLNGLECPLTLISAPAGYGKTTLLSEWATTVSIPIAWFSIDKDDNDPRRFMTYMVSALESIQSGIGSEALLMLRSFRPISMQTIQASLSNRMLTIRTPFALVLDDYHWVESKVIHQSMAYLLEHLPPQVHVIISTRSDPPLPLSRFRARNQMVEIRSQDLRFTSEESTDFLNRVMGLALPAEEIAILDSRTEGWAVGLQLAALSLRGRADPEAFIKTFSGSHHYILDYLVEEVLNRQPEPILNFLLRTSILERLNPSLCNAITNQRDSQKILEIIEKENLFLMPLDDERRWYRYHHLFAELLQVRLQEMGTDDIPELHRRAALWYEDHESNGEAIQHALAAKDFAHAAHLVEQSEDKIWDNEGSTVFQWMEAIPDQEFRARPRLYVYRAWVLIHDAHFEEARECLDSALQRLEEKRRLDKADSYWVETRGMLAALRSAVSANLSDGSLALSEARQATELLPESRLTWRGLAYLVLGFAYVLIGDVKQANQAMYQAHIYAQNAHNVAFSMLTQYNLGALQLMIGHLYRASESYRQVIHLADQYQAERLHELGEAKVDLAWVLCEWNDLSAAETELKHGLEIGQQIGSYLIQISGHLVYARIQQARGDLRGAFHDVRLACQIAETNQISVYAESAESFETRLNLLSGDFERARLWMHKQEKLLSGMEGQKITYPPHQFDSSAITFARVLFSEGKTTEALRWLDKLLAAAESMKNLQRWIEIFILRALIYQSLGDLTSAWSSLEQAIFLAEPHSFCRIILDEGSSLEYLLKWGATQGKPLEDRCRKYGEKLLQDFQAEREAKALKEESTQRTISIPSAKNLLVEPLTLRELEVLKLMAEGLSNLQIATQLVLSVGTVKVHIHHILEKLEVTKRMLAVNRAKDLNLLS